MKVKITLDEKQLTTAVGEYLRKRGYKEVKGVRFEQNGFPDSPDPRERGTSIEATADVEDGR